MGKLLQHPSRLRAEQDRRDRELIQRVLRDKRNEDALRRLTIQQERLHELVEKLKRLNRE